jgi:hypothetical protein
VFDMAFQILNQYFLELGKLCPFLAMHYEGLIIILSKISPNIHVHETGRDSRGWAWYGLGPTIHMQSLPKPYHSTSLATHFELA